MAVRMHVTFTLVLLCLGFCHTEDIQRVGNDIIASTSGANWDGTTFLLNDFALTDGVVFAFSAYFVNDNPVHFQIWRPIDADNREYQLIHEWPFQATAGGQREDVYIHTRQNFECIRILSTDRLGIYTVISPGAVAYRFEGGSPQVLQHTEQNLTLAPSPGDVIQFDSLAFPYEFSAAAYIDADLSSYPDLMNPSCPTNLLIPYEEETGSTQSPSGGSGNIGATGATGPSGPAGAEGPMGVIGATGLAGTPGVAGVPGAGGAAGQNGRDGVQGATGMQGPPGPEGPAGPPGQDASVSSSASVSAQYVGCDWCEKLFTPYVIMGFLVWLVIISLVLIIIVVVVACSRSKDSLHYPSNMRWTGSDLWKAYQDQDQLSHKTGGYENGGLEHNGIDQQTTYSYVEEGRTAF